MTSLKSNDLQNYDNQNYGTINNNATDEPPKSKGERECNFVKSNFLVFYDLYRSLISKIYNHY